MEKDETSDISSYLNACKDGEVETALKLLENKSNEELNELLTAKQEIRGIERTGLGLAFNQNHYEVAARIVQFFSEPEQTDNVNILCLIFPYVGALDNSEVHIIDDLLSKVPEEQHTRLLQAKTSKGWTSLVVACTMYDNEKIVGHLIHKLKEHDLFSSTVTFEEGDNRNTALYWACMKGHIKVANTLLKNCSPRTLEDLILMQNKYGRTALHSSCAKNQIDSIHMLLNFEGISDDLLIRLICKQDIYKLTVLHLCARLGLTKPMKELLKRRDKPVCSEAVLIKDQWGMTVLHSVLHLKDREITRLLLDNTEDPTLQELVKENPTILHTICSCEKDIAQLLLDKIEDVTLQNLIKEKPSLLHTICSRENTFVFQTIVGRLDSSVLLQACIAQEARDHNGNTILHACCLTGNAELTRTIVNRMSAACIDKQKTFKHFISVKNNNGRTALHISCYQGQKDVCCAIVDELHGETVEELMTAKDNDNKVALHIACARGDVDLWTELLKHVRKPDTAMKYLCSGSDSLDGGDDQNYESLICLSCRQSDIKVLQKLLDISRMYMLSHQLLKECDKNGKNPLWIAFEMGDLTKVRIILEEVKQTKQDTVNCIKDILLSKNNQGQTFFHYAFQNRNISEHCLGLIIEVAQENNLLGELMETPDANGLSYLHFICQASDEVLKLVITADHNGIAFRKYIRNDGKPEIVYKAVLQENDILLTSLLKCLQFLKLPEVHTDFQGVLCKKDDATGQSALHLACRLGANEIVKILLATAKEIGNGCLRKLLDMTGPNGQSVLHVACQLNKQKVVETLLSKAGEEDLLENLMLMKDNMKKSFLFNLHDAPKSMIDLLIKEVTDIDMPKIENYREIDNKNIKSKKKLLTYTLLTSRDRNEKTVLHYVPNYQKRWYAGFLDPFAEELKEDQQQEPETPNKERALEEQRSKHRLERQKTKDKKDVGLNRYFLFRNNRKCKEKDTTSLLTVMSDTNSLDLVRHTYTKDYLRESWKMFRKYIFLGLLLYVFLLLSLTFFVLSHRYESTRGHNSTVDGRFVMPIEKGTYVSQALLMITAILSLIVELCMMMGRTTKDNICDFLIAIACLAVSIFPLVAEYSPWIHQVGIFAMTVAWINFIWMLTKIPLFDSYYRKRVSLMCVMLFRVMGKVCMFLPIYLAFVLTFSGAFQIVFQTQDTFSHLGFAVMKTIAMTIGEIEFNDMFFKDSTGPSIPHYTFSFVLLAFFLFIVTISAMNLLIGVAVGDIRRLQENSEILAFEILIDRIFEYQAMTEGNFSSWKKRNCHRESSVNPSDHQEAEPLRNTDETDETAFV